MTFSIAARSDDGSMFGIAIASSSAAVAARCVHVRSGVGAVVSQNITDPALGPIILDAMARGQTAHDALAAVLTATPFAPYRQLLAIGKDALPAMHTGAHALGIHATAAGTSAVAGGNLLANPKVPQSMLAAFTASSGHHLASRLLQALRAGRIQGGECGPIRSAGLIVVREVSWPIVDLRIDWLERDPIEALAYLWEIYAPQMDDYVTRALNPAHAPAFGVRGDP